MGNETRGGVEQEMAKEEALNRYREAFQILRQATEQWTTAMLSQKNPALRQHALDTAYSAEEGLNRKEEELLKLGMSLVDVADLRRSLADRK